MANDGVGLLLPFRRDGKGSWATGRGDELLASRIRLVLSTEADSPLTVGELPWRTAFGSSVGRLRYMRNSRGIAETARALIQKAFARWLPDVAVLNVGVQREGTKMALVVRWQQKSKPGQEPQLTAVRL